MDVSNTPTQTADNELSTPDLRVVICCLSLKYDHNQSHTHTQVRERAVSLTHTQTLYPWLYF